MKAAILAGGSGKRLRPLTDTIPKPLVEVAGKPILEWQMLWLKSCGVTSFVMMVGHLKEKIIDYVDSKKSGMGVRVDYSEEKDQLGTAGALKNAERFLKGEEKFFMLNGDTVTNIAVEKMNLDSCIASIALVPLRSTYGITRLEGDRIVKFDEKPLLPEYWMNSGVYLMSKDIFRHLPRTGNLESTTFVELSKSGTLRGVKFPDAYFKGVDSIKDIEEVTSDLKVRKVFGNFG